MSDYKVYENVERKMIKTKNGFRYLVDFVFKETKDGKEKCLAIGYETGTNKQYGWVGLPIDDPVKAFVGYVEAIDDNEKKEYIKQFKKKHS